MSSVAFDTLKFTETLKEAGVPDKQARAEAMAMNEAFAQALDTRIATKADIKELDTKIDKSIKALDTKIDKSIKALDTKIDKSIKALDTKIDKSIKALDTKIDFIAQELRSEQRLMKWMLAFNLVLSFAMLSMIAALLLKTP